MSAAHAVADTAALTGRSLRHVLRSADTIITSVITPIVLMLMFTYVFGGAIETTSEGPYLDYVLPGILLITVAPGVAYTSYRLFLDISSGMVERLRSMPIARPSVLWAHALTSVVANLVGVAAVVAVALLLGFRSPATPAAWLAVLGIITLFTLTLTWVAVTAGVAARSVDGASGIGYVLLFLPFVSSAFVPTGTMPAPVAWFAEHQPATSVIDTIRALLSQQPVGGDIWVALAWLLGVLGAAYLAAVVRYRRRIG